ncbi:hypothetical protein EIP91_006305 [Steccherinum ochraceum]|uniref:N-acetyltransferase domain-containing protein n=1 Tax=Steccherinum ochraceum TaxID=92696 RepID=A0A4R0RVC2_9APHY|nr:hypothetical protein EIP91_006305 [Steccherinum ochraceum]
MPFGRAETATGKLVGHVFASSWDCDDDVVGWISQLVVDKEYRRRGVATTLVASLKEASLFAKVTVVGVASSHPVTCYVVSKLGQTPLENIDTKFISDRAPRILSSAPVDYIRSASLRGQLFQAEDASGAVSSVDTQFPIDHTGPLNALVTLKERKGWCLGELLEGHEFLLICPMKSRAK